MEKQKKHTNRGWLCPVLLVLSILVAATASIVGYTLQAWAGTGGSPIISLANTGSAEIDENQNAGQKATGYVQSVTQDGKTQWGTETQIEIFHMKYSNATGQVTVESSGKDKVLAPGTDNSYTFKLKNPWKVAMDYTMRIQVTVDAPASLPVQMQMQDYAGKYLVGEKGEWTKAEEVGLVQDDGTLSGNHYAVYTLDWQWPFEGEDEWDTMLGNLGTDKDLTVTVRIVTTASANPDEMAGGGMPGTGGQTRVVLYAVVGTAALAGLAALLVWRKKATKEDADGQSQE